MYYVISDSEGSTLDTFHGELDAMRALVAMVSRRPQDRDELLLLAYADDGTPTGVARLVDDVVRDLRETALCRLREKVRQVAPVTGTWGGARIQLSGVGTPQPNDHRQVVLLPPPSLA